MAQMNYVCQVCGNPTDEYGNIVKFHERAAEKHQASTCVKCRLDRLRKRAPKATRPLLRHTFKPRTDMPVGNLPYKD